MKIPDYCKNSYPYRSCKLCPFFHINDKMCSFYALFPSSHEMPEKIYISWNRTNFLPETCFNIFLVWRKTK